MQNISLLNNTIRKAKSFYHSLFNDNADVSLLSREESIAIKGFLILLIILGHNKYLMQGGYCYRFLYSFHVYSFFFLPFLYNWKDCSLKATLVKNLKRFYIPYTIIFIALAIISLVRCNDLNISELLLAWVCGSQSLLEDTFGIGSFLWFIPTMLLLLVIRWFYYTGNKWIRSLLLCGSLISLVGFASQLIGLAFFILMIAIMVIYPLDGYFYTYLTINRLICPTLILLFILSMRSCLYNSALLKNIGRYSFQLYLIHLFVYNGFSYLINTLR